MPAPIFSTLLKNAPGREAYSPRASGVVLEPSRPRAAGEIMVPAADGGEVNVFTLNGRHLRTLDSITGTLIHQFSYDAAGQITSLSSGDGVVLEPPPFQTR